MPTPENPLVCIEGAGEYQAQDEVALAFRAETDARLKAIHAEFTAEQQAGLETLKRNLRAWTVSHLQEQDIAATITLAERIRDRFAVFVLAGIGGSDLGGRTLHDALDDPFHNQRTPEERGGAPDIYFTGDTFDPKRLVALIGLLKSRNLLAKTCFNIVSKSGKTGETIATAMIAREQLREAGVQDWAQNMVATTGYEESSVLWQMNKQTPFFGLLPVPEGVGGRFSYIAPVGLLPFAVAANANMETPEQRLRSALAGQAEGHRRFLLPPDDPDNVAYRLARWLHYAEPFDRKTSLVFCNYADDAKIADWMGQLYTESIQERGGGLNIIGTRGPTGNHSLLNGILRGPREKVVLFLQWQDLGPDLTIPTGTGVGGDLAAFEGLKMTQVQTASWQGTFDDYTANGLACVTLRLARRDGYHLFLVMRTLMDAVAIKGRLQNLQIDTDGLPHPEHDLTYQQDGVEGYKKRTRENAQKMRT
jgi:glucose-6-phosphate isomerase